MGRKALVDFSLIQEICQDLKFSKNKFKGQLEVDEDGSAATDKKVKKIKRLLVSGAEKDKSCKKRRKQRKKKTPERFRQNLAEKSESDYSESESDNSSDIASERDPSGESDYDDVDGDSDREANDHGET